MFEPGAARLRVLATLVGLLGWVGLATLLGACRNNREKMESSRQALLAAATPCAAPATCTGKLIASGRDIAICNPSPPTYAPGEVVIVRELGGTVPTLARVERAKGAAYDIHFADGAILERPADRVVARVCR